MKIYTVERISKFDYDFSVEIKKCGCYIDKEKALLRAKEVYEGMCGEYEDEMKEYSDEDCYEDEASGKLYVEEDHENGYYLIAFGYGEDYEAHSIAIEEWELDNSSTYAIYRKCDRDLLIEDIKSKAIEMEIDLDGKDIEVIADRTKRSIDGNDSLWESYWMSIEYVLDEI